MTYKSSSFGFRTRSLLDRIYYGLRKPWRGFISRWWESSVLTTLFRSSPRGPKVKTLRRPSPSRSLLRVGCETVRYKSRWFLTPVPSSPLTLTRLSKVRKCLTFLRPEVFRPTSPPRPDVLPWTRSLSFHTLTSRSS